MNSHFFFKLSCLTLEC